MRDEVVQLRCGLGELLFGRLRCRDILRPFQGVEDFRGDQPDEFAVARVFAEDINPRQATFFHRDVAAGEFVHEQAHIGIVANEHDFVIGAEVFAERLQVGEVEAEVDFFRQGKGQVEGVGDDLGSLARP